MAEKIPSPEEIKGEIKKFTEEEVNTLRSFQSRMEQIVTSLGRVHYSRIKLDDQEKIKVSKIFDEVDFLKKEVSQLQENLQKSYIKIKELKAQVNYYEKRNGPQLEFIF